MATLFLGHFGVETVRAVKKDSMPTEDTEKTQIRSLTAVEPENLPEADDIISNARIAMLESLSDGISHELNSPLQILTDSLHTLAEMNATLLDIVESELGELSEDDAEEVSFIKEQTPATEERVRKGLGRIQDVIATFKIFAGQSNDPNRNVLDLGATLRAAVEPFMNSGVPIQLSVRGEASVHALQDDLNTIIGELLNNAIAATRLRWGDNSKLIRVKAEVVQGVLELEVIDQGVGIPPNVQSRIFNPFYSSRPDGVRRGRGLCVVDQLVRLKYQGSVSVYSRPEHGATLLVRLPIFK